MLRTILRGCLSPSTRACLDEAKGERGRGRYGFFDALHGYVYGRWPYHYISVGLGRHPLSRLLAPLARLVERHGQRTGISSRESFAHGYHGKVLPTAEATRLIRVDREIEVRDLERVLPYERARDIVLKSPGRIAALKCPCRSARTEPCAPLDVCLIVGEPFVSFILEHHPRKARAIDREEAVGILEAERRRGHVHHAFFKDAMLNRFYAICNCCSCCCGAMQAHRNGVPMLASSGHECRVDPDVCQGCGVCEHRCQFGALRIEQGRAKLDRSACLGCGVCVAACPQGALRLERTPERGEPLDVAALTGDRPPESMARGLDDLFAGNEAEGKPSTAETASEGE